MTIVMRLSTFTMTKVAMTHVKGLTYLWVSLLAAALAAAGGCDDPGEANANDGGAGRQPIGSLDTAVGACRKHPHSGRMGHAG